MLELRSSCDAGCCRRARSPCLQGMGASLGRCNASEVYLWGGGLTTDGRRVCPREENRHLSLHVKVPTLTFLDAVGALADQGEELGARFFLLAEAAQHRGSYG